MAAVCCVVCLGAILTMDFALGMDSDDEMVALLLEDELDIFVATRRRSGRGEAAATRRIMSGANYRAP